MNLLTYPDYNGNEDAKEFEELTNKELCTYLDGKSKVPQVYFASLMRSGNSLLRRILEKITGIIIGANFPTLLTGCFSLAIQGFKGEFNVDDKVWMVKAHWPYAYPFTTPISASKAIVLIRSPFDVLVSLW
jgi:hypothetical protein